MQPVEDVPYNRFLELLENKQIVTDKNYPLQLVVEDGRPTQTLRGAYIRQGVGPAPAAAGSVSNHDLSEFHEQFAGKARCRRHSAGHQD